MTTPYDLLMWVGAKYYPTPYHMVKEVQEQGLSKRLPLNTLPENVTPGISRIFLAHPRGRLTIGTDDMGGLWEELQALLEESAGLAGFNEAISFLPERVRWIQAPSLIGALWTVRDKGFKSRLQALLSRYEAALCPGVFAYAYYTGMSYTLDEGEDLPQHLAERGIEAHYILAGDAVEDSNDFVDD